MLKYLMGFLVLVLALVAPRPASAGDDVAGLGPNFIAHSVSDLIAHDKKVRFGGWIPFLSVELADNGELYVPQMGVPVHPRKTNVVPAGTAVRLRHSESLGGLFLDENEIASLLRCRPEIRPSPVRLNPYRSYHLVRLAARSGTSWKTQDTDSISEYIRRPVSPPAVSSDSLYISAGHLVFVDEEENWPEMEPCFHPDVQFFSERFVDRFGESAQARLPRKEGGELTAEVDIKEVSLGYMVQSPYDEGLFHHRWYHDSIAGRPMAVGEDRVLVRIRLVEGGMSIPMNRLSLRHRLGRRYLFDRDYFFWIETPEKWEEAKSYPPEKFFASSREVRIGPKGLFHFAPFALVATSPTRDEFGEFWEGVRFNEAQFSVSKIAVRITAIPQSRPLFPADFNSGRIREPDMTDPFFTIGSYETFESPLYEFSDQR